MSTVVLERARSKRTGIVDPAVIARRLQVLEAHHDANRQQSAPDIIVPRIDGTYTSMQEELIRHEEPRHEASARDQYALFMQRLHHDPWETVKNRFDEDFVGVLNGASYHVPARGTKQLPAALARHFLQKQSYQDKLGEYEKRMGARDVDQPISVQNFRSSFKPAVQSFEAMQETHFDPSHRKVMF